MGNVLTAIQILTALLTEALQVNQQIAAAQASGVDISPSQLSALIASYNQAMAQLNADIAKAASAGK